MLTTERAISTSDVKRHYTERFRNMPSKTGSVLTVNGKAPNNWYYSWDAGQVHYIALTTEAWFDPLQAGHLETQYKWLINDLIEANKNRDAVPWIIGHGHRSVYCSCDKDCDGDAAKIRGGKYGLEEIFMKYGVDFWINGHEHDYERSFPMYGSRYKMASNFHIEDWVSQFCFEPI